MSIIDNSSADQLHAASTACGSKQKIRVIKSNLQDGDITSPGHFFFGRFIGTLLNLQA
jgi:hypothetical protein